MDEKKLTIMYGNPKNWDNNNLLIKFSEKEKFDNEFATLIIEEVKNRGGIEKVKMLSEDEQRLQTKNEIKWKNFNVYLIFIVVVTISTFFITNKTCRKHFNSLVIKSKIILTEEEINDIADHWVTYTLARGYNNKNRAKKGAIQYIKKINSPSDARIMVVDYFFQYSNIKDEFVPEISVLALFYYHKTRTEAYKNRNRGTYILNYYVLPYGVTISLLLLMIIIGLLLRQKIFLQKK